MGPLGAAVAVALAVTLTSGAAGAADYDDPRCLLAEATRPDAPLYQPPDGSKGALQPTKRCRFGTTMSSVPDSKHPPEAPRLLCQTVEACNRTMRVVRVAGQVYLASPKDYRPVEAAAERPDRPTVQQRAPAALCLEATTTAARTWFFETRGDTLVQSRVTGAQPLERGATVGACRFVGDYAIGWHEGRRGMLAADALEPTCDRRAEAYFDSAAPKCRLPAWRGRATRTAYLYPLDDQAPGASREVVTAGAEVLVRSSRRGINDKLTWYEVERGGRSGLMNAATVRLDGLTTVLPTLPVSQCAATASLVRATCDLTLPVLRWADPAQMAGAPRQATVPAGVTFPVQDRGDGTRVALVLGTEALLEPEACVEPLKGTLALRVPSAAPASGKDRARCSMATERGSVGEAPVERLLSFASSEAQELAIMLRKAKRVANLLGTARAVYAERPLSLVDFVYLLRHGATDRLFVSLVRGGDGHLTPLHRAVYAEYGLGSAKASTLDRSPAPAAAPRCEEGPPPTPAEAEALAVAAKALKQRHPLLAREAYLNVLAGARGGAVAADALAGYRSATLDSGATARAVPILRARCEGADPLVASDACWLGAMAAYELGDAATAKALAGRLAGFPGLSARKRSFLTAFGLASGRLSDPASAGHELLGALRVARAACGDCGELVPQLELQLIRAAHDAEDFELAYELLLGLPGPMLAQHMDVLLGVLGAMERYDEILRVLEAARWGTSGGIGDRLTAFFWGAAALDRACSFEAAGRVSNTIADWIAARRDALSAIPSAARAADSLDLRWWTGETATSQEAPHRLAGRRLPEVAALWASGGDCGTWRSAAAQLQTLAAGAPGRRVPPGLQPTLRAAVDEAEQRCTASLAATLAAAPEQTRALANLYSELRNDLFSHILGELKTGQALLARFDELARARFARDASGAGMGSDAQWGSAIKRLPWPLRLASDEVKAANAQLLKRGQKPLGALPICGAADPDEAPAAPKPGAAAPGAPAKRATNEDFQGGAEDLDEAVSQAVACLAEAAGKGLSEYSLQLMVRYQPALQLVTARELASIDLNGLPLSVRTPLKDWARRSARQGSSCCISTRPGATRMLLSTTP